MAAKIVGFAATAVFFPAVLDAIYRMAGPSTPSDKGPGARFGAGVYAGLRVGWGLMLHLIGRDVAVDRAAAIGILSWWVVDSASSVATGYPLNALSNTAFLAMCTPILLTLRRP